MEPNIVNSTIFSTMDAEFIFKVGCSDSNIALIAETVPHEVVRLHFFVVLVIRSDDIDLLSQPCQFLGKLIDHHA